MKPTHNSRQNAQYFGDDADRIAYNRVWFNLIRVHRKFYPRISKALRAEGINDPIWYEILLEVERAGVDGQPMAALEEKLFVPQYALSRHVSRLEKAGYLRRTFIADKRRKQILFLTDEGMGKHEKIWPIYMQAMQDEFGPLMSTDDAYQLTHLLLKALP